MNQQKKFLEESRDNWQESAIDDKKQFLASFAISTLGITLAGIGIATMFKGDAAGGAMEVAVGAGLAVPSAKMGLSEIQDYADMKAHAAVRQHQIDELTDMQVSVR